MKQNESQFFRTPEEKENLLEQSGKAPVRDYLCANSALYNKYHL